MSDYNRPFLECASASPSWMFDIPKQHRARNPLPTVDRRAHWPVDASIDVPCVFDPRACQLPRYAPVSTNVDSRTDIDGAFGLSQIADVGRGVR